jgi:hypothetical protein
MFRILVQCRTDTSERDFETFYRSKNIFLQIQETGGIVEPSPIKGVAKHLNFLGNRLLKSLWVILAPKGALHMQDRLAEYWNHYHLETVIKHLLVLLAERKWEAYSTNTSRCIKNIRNECKWAFRNSPWKAFCVKKYFYMYTFWMIKDRVLGSKYNNCLTSGAWHSGKLIHVSTLSKISTVEFFYAFFALKRRH